MYTTGIVIHRFVEYCSIYCGDMWMCVVYDVLFGYVYYICVILWCVSMCRVFLCIIIIYNIYACVWCVRLYMYDRVLSVHNV